MVVLALIVRSVTGANYGLQAYTKASNAETNDFFGWSTAISGDTMVIAAPYEGGGSAGVNGNQMDNSKPRSGAAYVFVRSGNTWSQQAYLKASNPDIEDAFGLPVAFSGDTIVVGAPLEDSSARGVNPAGETDNSLRQSGAAYVFARSGTNWTQQAYLKASNTDQFDSFGRWVAVSGDTLVVGAPGESSDAISVNGNQANNSALGAGAAYVFVRSGTNWSQQAYLKAFNTDPNDGFGRHVAIDGDILAVTAIGEASNARGVNGNQADNSAEVAGAAYVFVRTGTNWHQEAYLKASNTDANDRFGDSVSISGSTILVGATGERSNARGINGNQSNNSIDFSGAVYAFVRVGTNWIQQAYIKASNTARSQSFGRAVSISGDVASVTAWGESSSSRGFNGNQTNTWAPGSGAAYVFVRSGTNWAQQIYVKAPNAESNDTFGVSAGISGDTAVVGAFYEDSSAIGIDGDQWNNGAIDSGAAYVFGGLGLGVFSDRSHGYTIRYKQTPGTTYRMERAPIVTGPWNTIATVQANELGIISVYDTNAPPTQGYYRTATP